MLRLLVPFLALVLAAIAPAPTPVQAAPVQDHEQLARAGGAPPAARRSAHHRRSVHGTQRRRTQAARAPQRVAQSRTPHRRAAQRRAPHGHTQRPTERRAPRTVTTTAT